MKCYYKNDRALGLQLFLNKKRRLPGQRVSEMWSVLLLEKFYESKLSCKNVAFYKLIETSPWVFSGLSLIFFLQSLLLHNVTFEPFTQGYRLLNWGGGGGVCSQIHILPDRFLFKLILVGQKMNIRIYTPLINVLAIALAQPQGCANNSLV